MKCDIFIRTFDGDCKWLNYCVKSIKKYATGFNNIIITYPENHTSCDVDFVKNYPIKELLNDGYVDQQFTKLTAK